MDRSPRAEESQHAPEGKLEPSQRTTPVGLVVVAEILSQVGDLHAFYARHDRAALGRRSLPLSQESPRLGLLVGLGRLTDHAPVDSVLEPPDAGLLERPITGSELRTVKTSHTVVSSFLRLYGRWVCAE